MYRRMSWVWMPLILLIMGCGHKSNPDPLKNSSLPDSGYTHFARMRIAAAQSTLDRELAPVTKSTALPDAKESVASLKWLDKDHLASLTISPDGKVINLTRLDLTTGSWSKRVALSSGLLDGDATIELFIMPGGKLFIAQIAARTRTIGKNTLDLAIAQKAFRIDFDSGLATKASKEEINAALVERVYFASTADGDSLAQLTPCHVFDFAGEEVQTLGFPEYTNGIVAEGLYFIDADVYINDVGQTYGLIQASYSNDPNEAELGSMLLAIDYDEKQSTLVRLSTEGLLGLSSDGASETRLGSFAANPYRKAAAWATQEQSFNPNSDGDAITIDVVHVALPGMASISIDWAAAIRTNKTCQLVDQDSNPKDGAIDDTWEQTALYETRLAWSLDGTRLAYIKSKSIYIADLTKLFNLK